MKTQRLELVPLGQAHSPGMFELFSNSEVCQFVGSAQDLEGDSITLPAPEAAESDKIIRYFEHYRALGEKYRWEVMRSEYERFVGIVGFNELGRRCELAFHLIRKHWVRAT